MPGKGSLEQYVAALIANLGLMVQGNQLGWPSPTLYRIRESSDPMSMDDKQKTYMVSILYVGTVLSPIPWGYLMDKYGRKGITLIGCVIPLTHWTVAIFAKKPFVLYICRFLNGVYAGLAYTVIPVYLGEISDARLRGALTSFIQTMQNIGVLYEYVIGPHVSYKNLLLCNNAAVITFMALFFFMPESPYWYMMKGRPQDTERALRWLRGHATPEAVAEELARIEASVKKEMQSKTSFKDLCATAGHRKGFIIVQILSMFQRTSGISGLMAYTSISLPKKWILSTDTCVLIIGIVWVLSVFISTILLDTLGRVPLMSLSCMGTMVPMIMISLWYFYHEDLDGMYSTDWIPLACLIVYGVFFFIGLGPVPGTMQSELFPSNLKRLASALTAMTIGFTSCIMNLIYLPIMDIIGLYFNFVIFAASSLLCQIFVCCYVIETKGKTLQEIQEELDKFNKSDQ